VHVQAAAQRRPRSAVRAVAVLDQADDVERPADALVEVEPAEPGQRVLRQPAGPVGLAAVVGDSGQMYPSGGDALGIVRRLESAILA
jgi:hypothetical protein